MVASTSHEYMSVDLDISIQLVHYNFTCIQLADLVYLSLFGTTLILVYGTTLSACEVCISLATPPSILPLVLLPYSYMHCIVFNIQLEGRELCQSSSLHSAESEVRGSLMYTRIFFSENNKIDIHNRAVYLIEAAILVYYITCITVHEFLILLGHTQCANIILQYYMYTFKFLYFTLIIAFLIR